jgi:formylglycine-generating enzyme required for sulfatase activity
MPFLLTLLLTTFLASVAYAAPGTVLITANAAEAQISVDGKVAGVMKQFKNGELLVANLSDGEHVISASYTQGDLTFSAKETVFVSPDTQQTVQLYLVSQVSAAYRKMLGQSARGKEPVIEMVRLRGGRVDIGADDEAFKGPEHMVTLPPFAMGKYEVSLLDWALCVALGGCEEFQFGIEQHELRNLNLPVTGVTFAQVTAYLVWLNKTTKGNYRLPSEAEWEYAAGAGSEENFSFGACLSSKTASFDYQQNNFSACLSEEVDSALKPVGHYPANAFGLHEMHGNASEWTADCWSPNYFDTPRDGSPMRKGDCSKRVVRGGGVTDKASDVMTTARVGQSVLERNGFRLARSLP